MKKFENIQNVFKTFKLNTETQAFELKLEGFNSTISMSSNAKINTVMQKDYFDGYEMVEMSINVDWCSLLAPCGENNQCKLNKYSTGTNGFKCMCNPESNTFGPLCKNPNPCTFPCLDTWYI